MTPPKSSFRHVWAMPIVLGVLTLAGLVVGLLEDGVWDVIATAALALPALVGAWCALRPAPPRH